MVCLHIPYFNILTAVFFDMFFQKSCFFLVLSFTCFAVSENITRSAANIETKPKTGIPLGEASSTTSPSKIIGVNENSRLNGSESKPSDSHSNNNVTVAPVSKPIRKFQDSNVPIVSEGQSVQTHNTDKIEVGSAGNITGSLEKQDKKDKKDGFERGRITPRKGVKYSEIDSSSLSPLKVIVNVSSSTPKISTTVKYSKPKFTIVKGDKESEVRKSFIESPTTGKDYVFPLVLVILAIPLVFLIVKLIYKRGSEYTERRYYDRMYLIDGMYNTR